MKTLLTIALLLIAVAGFGQTHDTVIGGHKGQLIYDPIGGYSFMLESGAIIEVPKSDSIKERLQREYPLVDTKTRNMYDSYFEIADNIYNSLPGDFWDNVHKRDSIVRKIDIEKKYKMK